MHAVSILLPGDVGMLGEMVKIISICMVIYLFSTHIVTKLIFEFCFRKPYFYGFVYYIYFII